MRAIMRGSEHHPTFVADDGSVHCNSCQEEIASAQEMRLGGNMLVDAVYDRMKCRRKPLRAFSRFECRLVPTQKRVIQTVVS
jgi:hypothetical protein